MLHIEMIFILGILVYCSLRTLSQISYLRVNLLLAGLPPILDYIKKNEMGDLFIPVLTQTIKEHNHRILILILSSISLICTTYSWIFISNYSIIPYWAITSLSLLLTTNIFLYIKSFSLPHWTHILSRKLNEIQYIVNLYTINTRLKEIKQLLIPLYLTPTAPRFLIHSLESEALTLSYYAFLITNNKSKAEQTKHIINKHNQSLYKP